MYNITYILFFNKDKCNLKCFIALPSSFKGKLSNAIFFLLSDCGLQDVDLDIKAPSGVYDF